MLSTTNAIVLSKLKYRDNDLIVKCYTQEHGIISFLVRGVLKSKKSNTKTAYFQLLSQIQVVFNYTKTRTLYTDADTEYANFHLLFLLKLSKYLGFYPDTTHIDSMFFNLEDGSFQMKDFGKHSISGENLILLKHAKHKSSKCNYRRTYFWCCYIRCK